jgi:hypothetical protein
MAKLIYRFLHGYRAEVLHFYCTIYSIMLIFHFQPVVSGDLHWDALLKANFEAVPMSIPIIALSFVYQVTSPNLQ